MTDYLLQRVTLGELWDLTHDPEKKDIDHPAFYCVLADGGLVKFWPPLTNDIVLKADKMKISAFE